MLNLKGFQLKRGPIFELLVAIQFLTRLPVSKNLNPTKEEFARCAPWFPVVGLVVGFILAVVARLLLSIPLAPGISAVLLLVLGVLSTGAFHEDGLADTIDGIGGGWTKEDALRIMRDSRIGSYGALALILLMVTRIASLCGMNTDFWPRALIMAHVIARWTILPLMKTAPYARSESPGLGKPIVENVAATGLAVSTAGVALLCLTVGGIAGLGSMVAAAFLTFLCGQYFKHKLGGITGDCLGAVAVLCEAATLLLFAFSHPAARSPWVPG